MPNFSDIQKAQINGQQMAWRDTGPVSDLTVVFVHGNPTSSYLWRNVVPHLAQQARCVAPDLIGMGHSAKLPDQGPRTYSYFVHWDYFNAWVAHMNLSGPVVLVGHNWGVPLAMDWVIRNPEKTVGLVHMEGQISPVTTAIAGDRFRVFNAHMHSPEMEQQVLEDNLYLDHYFFRYVENILSDEDRAVYQKPYLEAGHGRRPTIDWPCEIPVDGEPSDVFKKLNNLKAWMSDNDLPKLWIIPDTASIMTGERKETAEGFSCQTVLELEGGHYTPETSPDAVGRAVSDWLKGLKS